ncbi:MAG: glycosyltransferase [Bacteroidota bacterium]|nr:glycosyltransferase [Bacteroidota bacterium]
MKRVLIITYYWPPSGGAGVQRWLKFAKYLPQYGWEPIIYTPENPDFAIEDQSLQKDISNDLHVIKRKIWEPYELYKTLIGKKGQKVNVSFAELGGKQSVIHKLALSVRGNLLIPDPRCFWIKPSVSFLKDYLKDHPVDAIVSTGPPHSMHIIGLKLHRHTNIPWIADFRDPWTNIDFYRELNLSWLADKIHHKKEKQVLSEANRVVSVTPTWCRELSEKAGCTVNLVHNGYDEEDIIRISDPIDTNFSIVHIGSINAARNPKVLWVALNELLQEQPELKRYLKIKLVGNVEPVVFSDIDRYHLNDYIERIGYLSHKEAITFQQTSQLLLLLINNTPNANGILTGKLYEYMASARPILAIGPVVSDIATLLAETNAGTVVDFYDVAGMKSAILDLFERYKQGKLNSEASGYQQYSRRAQCGVMAQLLDDVFKIN